ncbi:SOF1_protein [Hexamita inflata]|uniref:SOF1 protein n=1 Tax=Hexamita inflata TaxID=28002 RepID=A0AA86QK81_9EUKA|nr:SOF1 protein [Hexamita inflata]
MPKPVIKAIMRSEDDFVRQDATQRTKFFSAQTKQDPFAIETEFVKARQAAKMSRLFAKPFVSSMGEHIDSVLQVETSTLSSTLAFSASADGCVKLFDLRSAQVLNSIQAHRGMVTGLQSCADLLITCGTDNFLSYYNLVNQKLVLSHQQKLQNSPKGLGFSSTQQFALATTAQTDIYDVQRYDPIISYNGEQQYVAFSKTEPNLVGAVNEIRFTLFDTRMQTSALDFSTKSRLNSLVFNPFQPHQVFLATDDTYAYSFDLRNTAKALDRYGGFPYPIISIDCSPDGRQLALGSNEGTIQLYNVQTISREGDVYLSTLNKRVNQTIEEARAAPYRFSVKSTDCYHNARMGQLNALKFSTDGYYIISGSDEGNVRCWKSKANQQEKSVSSRQAQAESLNSKLVNKFQNVSELHQILNSRKLPQKIQNQKNRNMTREQGELKKIERMGKRANYLGDQVRKE